MSKALENMTVEQLREHNQRLKAVLEEKKAAIEEQGEVIDKLQAQINQMQFQIDQMNRLLNGAKRERFISSADENQLTLPFDVEQEEAPEKIQQVDDCKEFVFKKYSEGNK